MKKTPYMFSNEFVSNSQGSILFFFLFLNGFSSSSLACGLNLKILCLRCFENFYNETVTRIYETASFRIMEILFRPVIYYVFLTKKLSLCF